MLEQPLVATRSVNNDLLSMLSGAITSDLDLQRVLQKVTDIGTTVSGAEFGAFFYNERDDTGRVYQLHVLSGAGLETFAAMPKPRITGLFEPTFTGVATVRSDDVLRDERFSGMPPGHLPVRSYLAVPVVTRTGEVIGALLFGHRNPGTFDEECTRTIEIVAAQAAVAVENARLFAAEQDARVRAEEVTARLALLQSLASRLSDAITADATVAALADVLLEPIGATGVGVFLRDGDGYRNVSLGAQAAGAPSLTFLPDELPNPVRNATVGDVSLMVADRGRLISDYAELCAQFSPVPATAIVLPLSTGAQRFGACVLSWDVERAFEAADLEMLTAAAAQVASALDRARLFAAEREARADLARSIRAATETSRALQRSLLPRTLPVLDGLTAAVRYQASDVDAEVGGDWYDIVPREHGAVLVIGDVQGHNLAAAALMGQLRTGLHAYLTEGHPVEDAVARANHLMSQLTDRMMATCCLVEVDLDAGQLRMVCAGHPSAICVPAGGDRLVVPEQIGLPLGVVADATWPVTTAPLGGGDRLVLYTDGLVERRSVDIYAGIERLRSLLPALADRTAEDAARSLVEKLGADAEDDVALLICDIAPTGAPNATRTFPVGRELTSVSALRGDVRRALLDWNLGTLEHSATLVVSELVTNIVRHTQCPGTVQVQPLRTGIRILASDDDNRLPDLDLLPDDVSTHGRGLFIVRAVADRWGVQLNSAGKTIWVELQLEQANLLGMAGQSVSQHAEAS
ncbi:SpoIIE family protein phosphatase [uncultured Jatrophihabitans sp.]|uniref:SpoIIE family protein phosphatase n=1 Tax=uncultured Jatrophihabitans sp. TaxID=1610747 RepID=UPI0035CBC3FF